MAKSARDEYDLAAAAVRKCLRMKNGGQASENRFGDAYQRLVREGSQPQIRQRMRP